MSGSKGLLLYGPNPSDKKKFCLNSVTVSDTRILQNSAVWNYEPLQRWKGDILSATYASEECGCYS
jgi:hypothetical protein